MQRKIKILPRLRVDLPRPQFGNLCPRCNRRLQEPRRGQLFQLPHLIQDRRPRSLMQLTWMRQPDPQRLKMQPFTTEHKLPMDLFGAQRKPDSNHSGTEVDLLRQQTLPKGTKITCSSCKKERGRFRNEAHFMQIFPSKDAKKLPHAPRTHQRRSRNLCPIRRLEEVRHALPTNCSTLPSPRWTFAKNGNPSAEGNPYPPV